VVAAIENTPLLAEEKKVKFVISGNHPKPTDYSNYPDFIYFDHQSLLGLAEQDLSRVAMISQSFKSYYRLERLRQNDGAGFSEGEFGHPEGAKNR